MAHLAFHLYTSYLPTFFAFSLAVSSLGTSFEFSSPAESLFFIWDLFCIALYPWSPLGFGWLVWLSPAKDSHTLFMFLSFFFFLFCLLPCNEDLWVDIWSTQIPRPTSNLFDLLPKNKQQVITAWQFYPLPCLLYSLNLLASCVILCKFFDLPEPQIPYL